MSHAAEAHVEATAGTRSVLRFETELPILRGFEPVGDMAAGETPKSRLHANSDGSISTLALNESSA